MANTRRTLADLLNLYADNSIGAISAQDGRDMIVSGDGHWTYTDGGNVDSALAIQTWYNVDMSAWATADRIYSLPTVAAVGDRVAICVTAGNASYELDLQTTSGSSDTINGVDASSTSWSRLFITGEVVVFRCVTANTAWIVEYDGRIPQSAMMNLSSNQVGGWTNATWVTSNFDEKIGTDVGTIANLTNDDFTVRRDGWYSMVAMCAGGGANVSARAGIQDGAGNYRLLSTTSDPGQSPAVIISGPVRVDVSVNAVSVPVFWQSSGGNIDFTGTAAPNFRTTAAVMEQFGVI